MNSVELTGRLTKDPAYTVAASGTKIAKFTLAVYESKEHTNFIQCVAFNKTADIIESRGAKKGTFAAVTGKWKTGSYEHDGRTVYTNDCIVYGVEIPNSEKKEETVETPNQWGTTDDESLPF